MMHLSDRRFDPFAWAPRGLSREQAARHIGVSATKFDELVADGRMPRPKKIDSRVVWDRIAIEASFSDLPESGAGGRLDNIVFARPKAQK